MRRFRLNSTYASILAALVSLGAVAGNSIQIERLPAKVNDANTKGYDDIKGTLTHDYAYGDHDDSVGTRSGSAGVGGNATVKPDTGHIAKKIDPIDCTHSAYKSLCKELMDYVDENSKPDTPPPPSTPRGTWIRVFHGNNAMSGGFALPDGQPRLAKIVTLQNRTYESGWATHFRVGYSLSYTTWSGSFNNRNPSSCPSRNTASSAHCNLTLRHTGFSSCATHHRYSTKTTTYYSHSSGSCGNSPRTTNKSVGIKEIYVMY